MFRRLALALPLLFALPVAASAQGLSPEEAVKRMKLPDGFSVRCVAHEPMIRQPTSISFDNRGRMWVLQYLQYPNYAGLKPVKQDQYLRTIWDKIPEPPPKGPKGLDRITILSDPDEHGVFTKSKDFVTGLNIASGFCIGNGGVYVVQPPYLLYYPDKNEDDVPDGDPEVLLSGFGMDDTHSLANSLQWGPDGWLYGAAGSTSTCKIRNLNHPKDATVEFQQGIWRFHPKTKKFELFSEGGGNTYGLDFDRNGQVIAGTNYGGFACLHQMQGAYYVKGFAKHGPLHNPHTYGYFNHIPYTGFKGGHVTCGGVVYQADTYPEQYRNQYIAANLLSNTINWHKLEAVGSSFKASHGGELIDANDPWFRPVDCLQGPDGCVYVVDFYDRRAAHLDPVDNWDKTTGRVFRIEYKGGPKYPAFDLRKKTAAELAELLKHPNVWYRREARQLLVDRDQVGDVRDTLLKWLKEDKGQLALESLWTLSQSKDGMGLTDRLADVLHTHPNEYVRAWTVRLAADTGEMSPLWWKTKLEPETETLQIYAGWLWMARHDPSPAVRAQIACTAKRLPEQYAWPLATKLLDRDDNADDPNIPLLTWWVLEHHFYDNGPNGRQYDQLFPDKDAAKRPMIVRHMLERFAQRWTFGEDYGWEALPGLISDAPTDAARTTVLRGINAGIAGRKFEKVPGKFAETLEELLKKYPNDPEVLKLAVGLNDEATLERLEQVGADPKASDADRLRAFGLLNAVRRKTTEGMLLAQLQEGKSDALRLAVLAGLEGYDDPKIGETVLAAYPGYSAAVKKRALQLLLARASWALPMFKALDAGKFPKADVAVEQARTAIALGDKTLTPIVEKHFGKLAAATAGEKQARITWLNVQIPREKDADPVRGKALFVKHCAACHKLHGEGGMVGPDLTTADRKNRGYLVAQIVDPSGYIRPEFVVQNVLTTDERKISGLATETGESITLVNLIDNKPVTTVIAKKDIADVRPSAVSLMPEKLLDTLSDPQIADLFAYLMSNPANIAPGLPGVPAPKTPVKTGARLVPDEKPPGKPGAKLRVCLVSGSFEYKSDDSLAGFKKYLEANFPVECTLVSAKSDKDKDLAGIENLEKCDVAVFFTRRLEIEGAALDAVKKYVASKKPIVGIRTASHGFQKWLEVDKEVLGGDYKGHFGAGVADIKVIDKQKDHAILKGISAFKTNGSLYKNPNVASDVTVLLQGYMGKETEPVAWTREKDDRRVFYTSLGHPDDFKEADFIRLLVNGLAWASKTELKAKK